MDLGGEGVADLKAREIEAEILGIDPRLIFLADGALRVVWVAFFAGKVRVRFFDVKACGCFLSFGIPRVGCVGAG